MASNKMPTATLIIHAEYDDEVPDIEELKSQVETINGMGRITHATLSIHKDTKIDLR